MKKHIYVFLGLSLLINLLQAYFTPISEDEAYYWLWSQNLDWGYFDHPPMIAWWISVGYKVFQNELGVRLLSVIFQTFSLFLLAEILSPKTKKQIQLFLLLVFSIVVIQAFGFLSTPDAPLLFFTILYLYGLNRFLKENSWINSIFLAISLAGLVYSKYHGILVILFTLLPILYAWWKNPKFYFSVFLSLIFYSPHLIWLFTHDFIPLKYHFLERSADAHFDISKIGIYLGIYFLGTAPLLCYFIVKSLWNFNFKSENIFSKSIWFLAVLPGVFFFISIFKDNVQPQWLLISFIAMTFLTYSYYSQRENLKLFFGFGIVSVILILCIRIVLIIPTISPLYKFKEFAKSIDQFDVENVIFEKYQEASVYKFYSPEKNVTVHRTLGNRKSQFSLWQSEKDFHGKDIDYISPWTISERKFQGGIKNYEYKIKHIPNYISYEFIEIQAPEFLEAKTNSTIEIEIEIFNPYDREIILNENSPLKLNVTYYKEKQYEIIYSQRIDSEGITLKPNEIKKQIIQFENISQKGEFKVCIGIEYDEIGSTYLSSPVLLNSF